MKQQFLKLLTLLLVFVHLTACASYKPATLDPLQPAFAPYSETVDDVTLSVKCFSSSDSKRFFDDDLIEKGFQPIQISILNESDKALLFSAQGIRLPLASPEEVAEKCHTSTVGRATSYGVAGLIIWPLLIPAVVDGIGSSKANTKRDQDFSDKSVQNAVISPYGSYNRVIFVPNSSYQNSFEVILVKKTDNQKITYQVRGI
jgi:hypothetical protein